MEDQVVQKNETHILHLEDNKEFQENFCRFLDLNFKKVVRTSSIDQALNELDLNRFDVVLLDKYIGDQTEATSISWTHKSMI